MPGLVAGERAITNAPAEKRGRIVVLGDSITAGYGLDPAQAYPALLQAKINAAGLPYDVVNAGVSGDTTSGGLRRIEWALSRPTDVLIVALGGNDGLRGVPPRETAANLLQLIQKARVKMPGMAVLLAGMQMPANMGRTFVEQYRALFPRVANEAGATLIPFLLDGVGGVAVMNQPDLIHPTAAGQKRIAENVWSALQKVLSERSARRN